jgi:hypothetical protein
MRTGILSPREPGVDLVRIISEGTYTSFPQALKEFISNSYDADATRVDISIDDDCSTIMIRDNGVGMTLSDFRDYFASIARPGKSGARTIRGRTRLGRPKIGRFGIGSLAIVGTADKFSIRSVRRGTGQGFETSIDLVELRRHFNHGEDLSQNWRFQFTEWDGEASATHFTEIRIEGLRPDVRSELRRPGSRAATEFFESTSQLSGIEELTWQLGMICPVSYSGGYPVAATHLDTRKDRIIINRARRILKDNFSVFLNGRPVRRQIDLPRYDPGNLKDEAEAALLNQRGVGFDIQPVRARRDTQLSFEGYVITQAMMLFPQEIRGIIVRIRGVAVGWHSSLNLGATGLSTMLPAMSGEIWADGLDEALQFDRESFREDHPAFRWLRNEIETLVRTEAQKFRARSAVRTAELKKTRPSKRGKSGKKQSHVPSLPLAPAPHSPSPPAPAPTAAPPLPGKIADTFIGAEIFERQPEYLLRLIPQINGCWEKEYYEACAMLLRRLTETLLITLYHKRGWTDDLRDPKTKDFFTLKTIINKVCGDQRIGLETRVQDGLKALKELGDVAAHDFRIHIRKSDLEKLRTSIRFTTERLLFKIGGTGP